MVLEIVDEQEAAFPVRPHGKAQGVKVLRVDEGRPLWQDGFHGREPVSKKAGKVMEGLEPPVAFPHLAELAQGRLIIIADLGHLGLVQIRPVFADGVGAAVEHVIPKEIAP